MGMESNRNSCFNDVCDKPIDHLLSLIKEYQDKLLVSFNEAIFNLFLVYLMKSKIMFLLLYIIVKPSRLLLMFK
jgi:hypothetical protein